MLRLPPVRRAGNFFARRRAPGEGDEACPAPPTTLGVVEGPLIVRPLVVPAERETWRRDMARHHYLGCCALVAESLCYTAFVGAEPVAHLGWAAAALRNAPRDRYLGWNAATKRRRLPFVVNNVRFLILPGIRQPNLASQVLAATLRRLVADWQAAHGHAVYLAETFVDVARFRGTCYRAANWIYVGQTRGFSRRGKTYQANGAPKAVFLYPLHPRARPWLNEAQSPLAGPVHRGGQEEEVMVQHLEVDKLPLVGAGGLVELLERLTDPRRRRGIRHSMVSVLALAVVAMLCGARSLAAIAQCAADLPEGTRRRLGVRPLRPPSEPTFRRVLRTIDVAELDSQLGQWVTRHSAGLAAQGVALDGKTARGSRDGHGAAVHLLSAVTHEQGVVVAQTRVAEKTNEIKGVVPLLADLDVRGAVVTGDAMFAQREIARYLVEDKHADYLFTVKDNQPTLRQDIQHLGHGAFPPGAAPRNAR